MTSETGDPTTNADLGARFETLVDPSGTPTVKLAGELDIAGVAAIRTAFDSILADHPEKVIIDLSELSFIDSSGLSVLLAVADQVSTVELRKPSPAVRRVIDLTGLSRIFLMTPVSVTNPR